LHPHIVTLLLSIPTVAGRDGSTLFASVHNSSHLRLLKPYLIGELAGQGKDALVSGLNDLSQTVDSSPVQQRRADTCEIVQRTQINHDSYSITFALLEGHEVSLQCGRHVTLQAAVSNGADRSAQMVTRSYTPVSHKLHNNTFTVLVKVYDHAAGRISFSRKLQQAPLGTSFAVSVNGACTRHAGGAVSLPQGTKKYKTISMIAAGTGIAPMYQILCTALADSTDSTVFKLLYGSRTVPDILLMNELNTLADQYTHRFSVTYAISQHRQCQITGESSSSSISSSSSSSCDVKLAQQRTEATRMCYERISADIISQCLPPHGADTLVLVCAPPAMRSTVLLPALASLGHTADHIFTF
jgi:ferredoxin-NADP reductase